MNITGDDLGVVETILIESQWNLNRRSGRWRYLGNDILIESQWNLNTYQYGKFSVCESILIESQWNLNDEAKLKKQRQAQNINRITVEFKFVFQ